MPARANPWIKLLPLVAGVVLVLSVISLRGLPPTTLRMYTPVRSSGEQNIVVLSWSSEPGEDGDRVSAAWRLNLRIEGQAHRPGADWLLYEGDKPGQGYELHWLPAHRALQLFRAGDPAPALLGSVGLQRFPTEVVFLRRGYHLLVQADGLTVLTCLDPLPTPPAGKWGLSETGPMPDCTFSLHDERQLVDPDTLAGISFDSQELQAALANPQRPDHIVLLVRYALGLDPERTGDTMVTALERAGAAVRSLRADDPDRAQLQNWLAVGELRLALARQDETAPELTSAALRQLVLLGEQQPVCEHLGLLLGALTRIAKVCAHAPAPAKSITWRRAWFDLLAYCAGRAEAAALGVRQPNGVITPEIDDSWRWQLRLLRHSAECLRGPPGPDDEDTGNSNPVHPLPWPRPTPVEAPDWVVGLWRAFANTDPHAPGFATSLPSDERNPILPALTQLIEIAGFDPGAAVSMRATILDALEAKPTDEVPHPELKALEAARSQNAPTREGVLAIALLALRGVGDPQQALAELDPDPRHLGAVTELPWARRDPLAYALYRLLQHRIAQSGTSSGTNPLVAPEELPETLIPFSLLLSGKSEATSEAWQTVLPPAQALAAALAMQEVLAAPGAPPPDWRLLDQVPCYTLPLRLMVPRARTATDARPHGSDTPPVVP